MKKIKVLKIFLVPVLVCTFLCDSVCTFNLYCSAAVASGQ